MVSFIQAYKKISDRSVDTLSFISCYVKRSHCCKFQYDVDDDKAFFSFSDGVYCVISCKIKSKQVFLVDRRKGQLQLDKE